MVKEIRVPSSSSSSSGNSQLRNNRRDILSASGQHTDGNRLDLDALFDVSAVGVVGILVPENGLTAQRVDEGCPTYQIAILAIECHRSGSLLLEPTYQYPRHRKPSSRTECPSSRSSSVESSSKSGGSVDVSSVHRESQLDGFATTDHVRAR